jgi:ABC-2 type transport system ATP-binding protein
MSDQMTVLEVRNLVKTYSTGVRALDGLSFSVRRGIIFGFIGLNGAGKSSTIRIIAGLSRQDEGTIRVFGEEVTPRDEEYKRRVGFVLDEPLYFDWMAAGSYLHFVGVLEGLQDDEAWKRADELLDFLDLGGKGDDPIATFSTGMKKKVSLAAAIIHKPALIVLDEPLEGVDALAAAGIKSTLAVLAAAGSTVVITSHVLDTIERLCSEIGIIHAGKLLLQGPTDQIHTMAVERSLGVPATTLEELFVGLVSGPSITKTIPFLSNDSPLDHRSSG